MVKTFSADIANVFPLSRVQFQMRDDLSRRNDSLGAFRALKAAFDTSDPVQTSFEMIVYF